MNILLLYQTPKGESITPFDARLKQPGFIFNTIACPSAVKGEHAQWLKTQWRVVDAIHRGEPTTSFVVEKRRELTITEIEYFLPIFEELGYHS